MIHFCWLLLTASVGGVLGHAYDQSNLHDGKSANSFQVPGYLFPTLLNDHELTTLFLPTWTTPPCKPQYFVRKVSSRQASAPHVRTCIPTLDMDVEKRLCCHLEVNCPYSIKSIARDFITASSKPKYPSNCPPRTPGLLYTLFPETSTRVSYPMPVSRVCAEESNKQQTRPCHPGKRAIQLCTYMATPALEVV